MSNTWIDWFKLQWCLYVPTALFVGVSMAWGVQIGHMTPLLREFGLSDHSVGLIWLTGPISGIIIQPIIGVMSDRCQSVLGRRRPFLIAGSICVMTSLLIISNAEDIGYLLGDLRSTADDIGGSHLIARIISIVTFVILDFSINVVQAPIRALLVDTVAVEHHATANAYMAFNNGFGKTLGYLLGGIDLLATMPWWKTNIRALFSIAVMVVGLTSSFTVVFTTEEKNPITGNDQRNSIRVLADSFKSLKQLPKPIMRCFFVQFCAYTSWYICFVYLTNFVGENVFGGVAEAPDNSVPQELFEQGVRFGSMCLFGMSLCSVFLSFLLPYILKYLSLKTLWALSLQVFALALVSFVWAIDHAWLVAILVSTMGLPLATTFTIPWAIVTASSIDKSGRNGGLYTSTFNLSQCFPEILVSFASGPLLYLMGVVGAIASLIGSLLVAFVIIPDGLNNHIDKQTMESLQINFRNRNNVSPELLYENSYGKHETRELNTHNSREEFDYEVLNSDEYDVFI